MEKLPQWKQSPKVFTDLMRPFFESLSTNLPVPADTTIDVTAVGMQIAKAYIAWIRANNTCSRRRAIRCRPAISCAWRWRCRSKLFFSQLAAQLDEALKDVPGTLQRQGLTERQALAMQFSPAMMAKYDTGTLTVATACREEPKALFVFAKDEQSPKMQRVALKRFHHVARRS